MLTARSARSGTRRSTGSLIARAPAGIVVDSDPLNVSTRSEPAAIDAPVLRRPTRAAPMCSELGAVGVGEAHAHLRAADARVHDLANGLAVEFERTARGLRARAHVPTQWPAMLRVLGRGRRRDRQADDGQHRAAAMDERRGASAGRRPGAVAKSDFLARIGCGGVGDNMASSVAVTTAVRMPRNDHHRSVFSVVRGAPYVRHRTDHGYGAGTLLSPRLMRHRPPNVEYPHAEFRVMRLPDVRSHRVRTAPVRHR